ncbi:hypothetical protein EYF80_055622 [Liparis tanakae]|uniref:Uncharacterized protein n=1 Tax=Liparis tanakae TaxID=230148 RepID=A0A4Z2EZD4_9TELE|nr:hypothetical protein EYF80_055622 [Liparis tanakae]
MARWSPPSARSAMRSTHCTMRVHARASSCAIHKTCSSACIMSLATSEMRSPSCRPHRGVTGVTRGLVSRSTRCVTKMTSMTSVKSAALLVKASSCRPRGRALELLTGIWKTKKGGADVGVQTPACRRRSADVGLQTPACRRCWVTCVSWCSARVTSLAYGQRRPARSQLRHAFFAFFSLALFFASRPERRGEAGAEPAGAESASAGAQGRKARTPANVFGHLRDIGQRVVARQTAA